MANPYTTWVKGVRRTAQQAWTVARSNLANIGLDYVVSALEKIIDLDAADGKLLSTVDVASITPGATSTIPSSVETGQNARRIIIVDLDDPNDLWDYAAFMQLIQDTSWHDSLGDPPVHGLMWINEAQTVLTWWNRDTEAVYLTVTGAVDGVIEDATPLLTDVAFKDGKIMVCGTGGADQTMFDLLNDYAYKWDTGGFQQHKAALGDFTSTAGWGTLSTATGAKISGNTVNECAFWRHRRDTDEFGRPKHWWIACTTAENSVYNPDDDAIYDSTGTNPEGMVITDEGILVDFYTGGSIYQVDVNWHLESATADGFSMTEQIYANNQSKAEDLPWTNAAIVSQLAALSYGSHAMEGMPILMIASDQGLLLCHMERTDNRSNSGVIRLDADFASPYQKGDIRAAWPLHSTTDASVKGHTLTNNNTVTFSDGGPAGSYANLVAASSMSLSLVDHADHGGMSELTLALWFYRDLDSGASEGLLSKYDQGSGTDQSFILGIDASDQVYCAIDTSAGDTTSIGPAISLAQWYYLVAVYDGVNLTLYLNAEQVDQDARTGTIDNSTETLFIGAESSGGTAQKFFDGRIGGVSISATAMSQREIRAEYQRGLRRINSAIDTNDTIPSNDVDAIAVDRHGKYFAIGTGDEKVTIFDALGVPISQDTYPGTAFRDVAIKSYPGLDDPYYAMAGDDQVEFVGGNQRVMG